VKNAEDHFGQKERLDFLSTGNPIRTAGLESRRVRKGRLRPLAKIQEMQPAFVERGLTCRLQRR